MSDTCCGICGLNVEEEARIECTCTRADCATASYHVPCIEDYVQRNFKNGPSKTRFNVRATVRRPPPPAAAPPRPLPLSAPFPLPSAGRLARQALEGPGVRHALPRRQLHAHARGHRR
jgi:hypothetical protein